MCFRKRNRMKRTNRFNSEQGRRSDKEIGYNRNWLFLLGLRIWVDYLLKCSTGGILLQNVNFSRHQARHVSSQEPCSFIVGLKKEILSIWQWIIVEEVMAGLLLVTSFEQETGSWWPENDINKGVSEVWGLEVRELMITDRGSYARNFDMEQET